MFDPSTTRRRSALNLALSLLSVAALACGDDNPAGPMPMGDGGRPNIPDPEDGGGATPPASPDGAADDEGGAVPPTREFSKYCAEAHTGEPLPQRAALAATAGGGSADGQLVLVDDLFAQLKTHCGSCHVDANLGGLQLSRSNFATNATARLYQRIRLEDESAAVGTSVMPPQNQGGKAFSKRKAGDPVAELARLLELWIAQGKRDDAFELPVEAAEDDATASPYKLTPTQVEHMTNLGTCIPKPEIVGTESDGLDAFFASADAMPERLSETDLFTLDSEVLARHGTLGYSTTYPLWTDDAGKQRYVHVPAGKSVAFDAATQSFDIPENTRFYKTFMGKVVERDGSPRWRKLETRVIVSRKDERADDGSVKIRALYGTYVWNADETEATLLTDPLRDGTPFRDRLFRYTTDESKLVTEFARAKAAGTTMALAIQQAASRTYALPGSVRCVQCHMGRRDFSAGFDPLQLNHRPLNEGGVYTAQGPDELTILQRFIDAGVVTGIKSLSEVAGLEASQGDRSPRNGYELRAQAYVLGNCSHCHNPLGFPSVQAPELRDVLDFRPSLTGGVFQFPMDRVSPRVRRGAKQDVTVPYISPWPGDHVFEDGMTIGVPKVAEDGKVVPAPWRSFIYRNVDSRQTYAETGAIFPHMPLHSPGYDCRAPQMLGSWMLSVPVRFPNGVKSTETASLAFNNMPVEARSDDPAFARWAALADQRVTAFNASSRLRDCRKSDDIVNPPLLTSNLGEQQLSAQVDRAGVPSLDHFIALDMTDPPGEWAPRRADFRAVLEDLDTGPLHASDDVKEQFAATVLDEARELTLDDGYRAFARQKRPFAVWKTTGEAAACDFSAAKRVRDLPASARPRWLDFAYPPPKPDEPVYEVSPGEQVFQNVCSNCHGRQADSNSPLANTILTLTGGDTRVANLRDGLFGPISDPGQHRVQLFGGDDLAARYVAWMTLGGTRRTIPTVALAMVDNAQVAGLRRGGESSASANMLSLAVKLCQATLPATNTQVDTEVAISVETGLVDQRSALIIENGDAELWEDLCRFRNPRPVLALAPDSYDTSATELPALSVKQMFRRDRYGAGAVGSIGSVATTLTDDNPLPWCIWEPVASRRAAATAFAAHYRVGGQPLPLCPTNLTAASAVSSKDIERWSVRGAMNAAVSVFSYLDDVARGRVTPAVRYDECRLAFPTR